MTLSWQLFGMSLLRSLDLDPLYVALHRSGIGPEQLKRWCLAYWFYYDAALASRLSELTGDLFFAEMFAVFPSAKRGTERRHFRGDRVFTLFRKITDFGLTPEDIVDGIFVETDSRKVMDAAKRLPMVGDWAAWKIADMGERVLGYPVDFSHATLDIYDDTKKGAAIILGIPEDTKMTPPRMAKATAAVLSALGALMAPPDFSRKINIQEVETIFCKFKSHVHGKYPLGKDTKELWHALRSGESVTAQKLTNALFLSGIGPIKL